MDTEIDQLKQEVEELRAVSEDTNKMVHKMRRAQRWHTIMQIAWWLTIAGVSGAAYYYYVQPYVQKIMDSYGNAQDFQVQVQHFFANFGRKNTQ